MKKIVLLLTLIYIVVISSYSCDKTSISITNVTYDGTTYYYTANVCIGISPNWGETNSFSIVIAGACATGLTTTSFTSTYNYCSKTLSFNGQGCAITAMGAAPAGGTVQTANVNVSGSVGGGGCSTTYNFSGGGGNAIGPDDLVGDCADCGNPSQLCWDIIFETDAEITSAQLVGAEGSSTTCPDEIDVTIPAAPAACSLPVLSSPTISSSTVCEGDMVTLNASCTSNCSGSYNWSGPGGFSGSGATDTDNPTTSGTYTVTYGSGSCVTSASVAVTVNALPTAAFNTTSLSGCTTVDVPITFTGTGPYGFSYSADGGSTYTTLSGITNNPYYITVSSDADFLFSSGAMGSPAAGVTSGICAGVGTTSGTTAVTISTVDADAGSDWSSVGGVDYNMNGTGTSGLDGYDTTITPQSTSNSSSGTFLNNDAVTGFTAGSINISSLGLTCGSITYDNIPDNAICFTYTGSKASNIKAELCLGGTCITLDAGSISGSPFCFDKGDVFNLLNGSSCSSGTLTLQVWDVQTGGGPAAADGVFTGWDVTLNDFSTTIRSNPTYSWSVSSGDASLAYLSCTDCEDPVFNSPTDGTGCYNLTVTDGFGCSTIDEVCYTTVLSIGMKSFDVLVSDYKTVLLNWEALNNNYYKFTVERSVNQLNFTQLGEITQSENLYKYSFEDQNPLNSCYYRVKGFMKDGSFEYSQLKYLEINENKSSLEILNAYPMPINNNLNIEFISQTSGNINYKIIDIHGQNVKEQNVEVLRGNSTIVINMDDINSGNYFVVINNGHKQAVAKIFRD